MLARILAVQGRFVDADQVFVRARAGLVTAPAARAGDVAELAVAYAINLESLDRADEPGPIVVPVLAALRAAGDDYYLGVGLMFAADHYWRLGDPTAAHAAAREARAALAREGDSPDELAELASWVARHPAPRSR